MNGSGTPRISRWLLVRAARMLGADDLAGDAAELYDQYVRAHGKRAAARWYRAQARAAVWQVLRGSNLTGLSLDARLGFRMLRRYPGLTLIGGLAMAFAIFVGSALFEFINQTLPNRHLPVPAGERVVGLRNWDRLENRPEPWSTATLRYWQQHLTTIDLVGGFVTTSLPVETSRGTIGLAAIALMTPEGFTLAGQAPLLGRTFDARDVEGGPSPVVVIGHSVWQSLFAGDAAALGQHIRVGSDLVTVIGVMPEGFRFPVSQSLWLPLDTRRDVAGVRAFGRLRHDVPLEQAQQELDTLAGTAPGVTDAGTQTRPRVQWYRESMFDVPISLLLHVMVQQLNLFAGLFLMLVSANIALLMFARAATRERELVLRSALGAGRRRIIIQFLLEALVLFGGASGIGLLAVGPGLAWIERRIGDMGGGTSPFWFTPTVSLETVVYAVILTLLAAAVAGGLPALRATRQLSASRIHDATLGVGRLRLGGLWSVVVVVQVAATVVFTAGAALMWWQAWRTGTLDSHFPANEYIAAHLAIDDDPDGVARLARIDALVEELSRQPGVNRVTFAERLPLMTHGHVVVELEAGSPAAPETNRFEVAMPMVGQEFFTTFQAPVILGRTFVPADHRSGAQAVVIDQAFATEALGGRPPIGHRLRLVGDTPGDRPGPWLEIVGVVQSLESNRSAALSLDNQDRPFVYRPMDPDRLPGDLHLALHAPPEATAALLTIRQWAGTIDSRIAVRDVQTLDSMVRAEAAFWQLWAQLILGLGAVALLLALAGIYAVMSFTVTRRSMEIGIRMALGASGVRVALDVLRRPARHVMVGLVTGCCVVVAGYWTIAGLMSATELAILATFGFGLAGVCALACLAPARRALSVQPARALGSGDSS